MKRSRQLLATAALTLTLAAPSFANAGIMVSDRPSVERNGIMVSDVPQTEANTNSFFGSIWEMIYGIIDCG